MINKVSGVIALALCGLLGGGAYAQTAEGTATTNGMIFLINVDADEEMDGLLQWEKELKSRGVTAMVDVSGPVLDAHPQLFKRLAQGGHAVIGGNQDVCWDVPYEEQYEAMQAVKANVESLTGKPMQVYGCKYFSYDENTVKAAEALGVPYVLGRGTEDIRALIYKPEEYDVGIIKVSNVEFSGMGRGSLCDISLYWRGASEADFAQMVEASLAQSPDSMVLVSHPHIGGTKAGYWNVYADALDSPDVHWRSFGDWLDNVTVVTRPYSDIPENRDVQYVDPAPVVPLDQLQDLPTVGEKLVMFHNGKGPMCKDAQDFLAGLDYPVEEHLVGQKNFYNLLDRYRVQVPNSEGVSEDYGYFPIIFLKDRAFSGFDQAVKTAIEAEIGQ